MYLALFLSLLGVEGFSQGLVRSWRKNRSYHDTRSSTMRLALAAKAGNIVTVQCRFLPEGDFVPEPLFDGIAFSDEDPFSELSFVLGEGNYLPGLHDLVATMRIGDKKQDISMDAGWGAWNPDLTATISFASLEDSGIDVAALKPGVELTLENGMVAVVTKSTETDFVIDANPPLAGASYIVDVELTDVEAEPNQLKYVQTRPETKFQVATVAMGCFWGTELAFMREPGVVGTKVGYTQGSEKDPTYETVCSGTSGHTESVMVVYDETKVSYNRLVQLVMERLGENKFLLNQVGNDKGTQYRHGLYYHNDEQKATAEAVVRSFGEDCVTEVLPATHFYVAEDGHQQYLLRGGQSARKGDDSVIRCYG